MRNYSNRKIAQYTLTCMLIYIGGVVLMIPVAFLVAYVLNVEYMWMCTIPVFLSLIASSIFRMSVYKQRFNCSEYERSASESAFYVTAVFELLFVLCGIIIIFLD